MEKKEVYYYKPSQEYAEFTTNDPVKAQSEFNQNAERFYHDDEFNQKADFKTSKFKLKKAVKKAETDIIETVKGLIKPLVVAVTVSTVVIVPTVIDNSHKHTVSDWIIDTPATCTQTGLMHKECLECGEVLRTEEIPMEEHQFTDGFVVEVEPSCTHEGYEVIRCTVCGFEKERHVLEMTEHVPSEVIIDADPSCTEEGHQHIECLICGTVLSEETEPAIGHKFGSWKTTKRATCLRTGTRERTCSRCGEKETETIDKIKHYFILNENPDIPYLIVCRYCHKDPGAYGLLIGEGSDGYMILYQNGSLYQLIPY
ncbi:MAG: hypothetical protein IJM15_06525 [Erysipelotrichaceae bacterium]|nr:hypothetical protein [Erysipelotrichaceae bacterium]